MSVATSTVHIAPLEGVAVAKHRRGSFADGIELADLGGVTLDSKGDKTPSILSTTQVSEPMQEISLARERMFLAALCWGSLVMGWNDGSLGPLIPRLQEYYHLGYTAVSMIFVCTTAGCITGSFAIVWMNEHLGFGKMVAIVGAMQTTWYAILSAAPPFPAMCAVYVGIGFVRALQGAMAQTFLSSMKRNLPTNLGILHACYGLGAFAAPLVATQFSQLKRWSFLFLISMGLALTSFAVTMSVFRMKRQEDLLPPDPSADSSRRELRATYKQIFTQKFILALAAFMVVYVGIEVSIGGWIVTYLMKQRAGGVSSGYVSSGFFGGMMLGRLLLLPVNQKVGKQRVIYLYTALVIGLQLTVWLVPSLIENAIAVSFVGLFLGPIFPVAINVAAGILPMWLLAGALGFIGAFGQAGSAVFPFMTGAIASKYGVQVLQPIMVALMSAQMALWYFAMHSKVARTE